MSSVDATRYVQRLPVRSTWRNRLEAGGWRLEQENAQDPRPKTQDWLLALSSGQWASRFGVPQLDQFACDTYCDFVGSRRLDWNPHGHTDPVNLILRHSAIQ